MKKKRSLQKKICLVSGSSPSFLGGISLYQNNLIKYAKDKGLNIKFTWIYEGSNNSSYFRDGVEYVEVRVPRIFFIRDVLFGVKVSRFLNKRYFDIINSHAIWGYFLNIYKKRKNQLLVHTYHGVTYPYLKIQLKQFNIIKRAVLSFVLLFVYLIEYPPMTKSDKIICVSEKVKKQLQTLYHKNRTCLVVRTGVNLDIFKPLSKTKERSRLGLKNKHIYGLYVGRGGYWNKGLDRAIILSKELYKINKNYRLIVIGADKDKCFKYLKEKFVLYRGIVNRDKLPSYYSSADFFFSLSRYEGGAPTLALSEAVSSGCMTVCSKDMEPEILKNKKDCLIIGEYGSHQAREILNKNKNNIMKKSASKKIKGLSIDKWGKNYFGVLLK